MERYPRCPHYRYCNNGTQSLGLGGVPAIVSITSSILSCIGSLLIVYTYLRWKDVRSGSRSVITFLAIADFFTAFGYVLGSSNYLAHFEMNYNEPGAEHGCPAFINICAVQSYLTTWSSISSFVWTSFLAFYFYLIVVKGRLFLATRLIPWFHVIAWGLPIAICLPLLITGHLGFAPYGASTWCFISDKQNYKQQHLDNKEIGIILVAGKFWEILTYAVVIVLYTAIKCHFWKETQRGESKQFTSTGLVAAAQRADRRLTFIPVVFILLRIWGTIQFFYSIIVSRSIAHYKECVSNGVSLGFLILGYLQAIGDGGQGWGNVILFIFASEKLRKRLFGWMIVCVCKPKYPNCVDCPRKPIVHGFKEQYATFSNHSTTMNNPGGVSIFGGKIQVNEMPLPEDTRLNGEPLSVISHEPTTEFNSA